MTAIVVMGVCGCGKSSVGQGIAAALGLPFTDGDDLHPAANVAKMASGQPLTDADRWPWLTKVGETLAPGGVVACSALKRSYRDHIRKAAPDVRFVYLHGDRALLAARLAARPGHFMPPALLDSQLATLEIPQADENPIILNIAQAIPELVTLAATALNGDDHPHG
ncbi:gluconokinase [Neogemmobacter tilapiae]|uniref:Gluconokinase n=1 Tax=Neogemmobacter tilapiae TaxID=875041 RepID=A0A918TYQ5_9RHOB|nr:gluconokinase [Gemmobacter tilapiae]GHC62722.1 gluconokinase [Gemmobacter tilapiae]